MTEAIVIIDDEQLVRESLQSVLQDEGYRVFACESYASARETLLRESVDIVLLDVWLDGEDGMEIVPKALMAPSLPFVIMISGHASIEQAVKCTKLGAYDFLEKPISIDRLLLTVSHAINARQLQLENKNLREMRLKTTLVGSSRETLELHNTIASVARSQSSVLICGENGSGKEVVARLIHAHSPRANYPFVAVNCAAIPDTLIESELFGYEKGAFTGATHARIGKIESAHLGTLFLDEVGDLTLAAQAKLLRVIQEKMISRLGTSKEISVNVRWLAATNKNLEQMVRDGQFREDLLYRLNVIRIDVPPLRDRSVDLELLVSHFVKEYCREADLPLRHFTDAAMERLRSYDWPGNIRELKNVIERAVVMSPGEELDETSVSFGASVGKGQRSGTTEALLNIDSFKEARSQFERLFLKSHLLKAGENVSKLAKQIGLERTYLHRKLKEYDLGGES